MNEIKCPKCGHASTVEFWDRHTKSEEGIDPNDDSFVSLGDSKDDHDLYQTYYRCPLCNEEVLGSDLVK